MSDMWTEFFVSIPVQPLASMVKELSSRPKLTRLYVLNLEDGPRPTLFATCQSNLYLQCRLNEANSPPLLNDLFSIYWVQNLVGLLTGKDF